MSKHLQGGKIQIRCARIISLFLGLSLILMGAHDLEIIGWLGEIWHIKVPKYFIANSSETRGEMQLAFILMISGALIFSRNEYGYYTLYIMTILTTVIEWIFAYKAMPYLLFSNVLKQPLLALGLKSNPSIWILNFICSGILLSCHWVLKKNHVFDQPASKHPRRFLLAIISVVGVLVLLPLLYIIFIFLLLIVGLLSGKDI